MNLPLTTKLPLRHGNTFKGISSSPRNAIAIVTIHDPEASQINQDGPYHITPITREEVTVTRRTPVIGAKLFLHRITHDQTVFNFGRRPADKVLDSKGSIIDIFLPGTKIGQRQFALSPDWVSDCWRLQSFSETVAVINGVPIQNYTSRTRRCKNPLPHVVYLSQDSINQVTIQGLHVTIEFLKTVRDVFRSDECPTVRLYEGIQDVTHRTEPWAQTQFLLTQRRVSTKSTRAIQRFTGQVHTVKLFEDISKNTDRARQIRDHEFLTFHKQEVDNSIVRYLQKTEINGIPAIITDSHSGFTPFHALQTVIQKMHPGARFAIARKLVHKLFSALAFMHFHGIVHGHVNIDSILLRFIDDKAEDVLLVDYTAAQPFVSGEPIPIKGLVADGRAAMMVIEKCCELWTLRNGPAVGAMGEDLMEKRTQDAMNDYRMVQRVASDFFERQGHSRQSTKGQKLTKLLFEKTNDWHRAQKAQAYNVTLREVRPMSKARIDAIVTEWHSTNPLPRIGEKNWMILSLGQSFLDNLANHVFQNEGKGWNFTPSEICAKIRELGGRIEEPWQTFEINKTVHFERDDRGYGEHSILAWLASCCEIYPEWRNAIRTESDQHLQLRYGRIQQPSLGALHDALSSYGTLATSMASSFNLLSQDEAIYDEDERDYRIEETHQVWYHIPSRTFNLTQIQRLATPSNLVKVINGDRFHCENFVEVRGDPDIQGNYVSLALLETVVQELGLALPQLPELTPTMPTFDPADFSQMLPGRVVLAQKNLLGYASVIRSGDQCNFLEPKPMKDFETAHAFLPTYFGDMKVLAQGISNHERPSHWSKFKTADEIEAGADLSKRRMLATKRPSRTLLLKAPAQFKSSKVIPEEMDLDERTLSKTLRQREELRASAQPPPKRHTDRSSSELPSPSPKRLRSQFRVPDISMSFVQRAEEQMSLEATRRRRTLSNSMPQVSNADFLNTSFMKRNAALFMRPPREEDINQSFTVADDTENLEEEWAQVETMLTHMPDSDDEGEVQGLTGFVYHGDDDTEEDDDEMTRNVLDRNKIKDRVGASTGLSPRIMEARSSRRDRSHMSTVSVNASRSHLATPQLTSPGISMSQTLDRPLAGTSTSNLHNDDNIMFPPTRPSSPNTLTRGFNTVTPARAHHFRLANTPGIQNSIFSDASSAITRFFEEQNDAQNGGDDLPDTDVESFGGDEQ